MKQTMDAFILVWLRVVELFVALTHCIHFLLFPRTESPGEINKKEEEGDYRLAFWLPTGNVSKRIEYIRNCIKRNGKIHTSWNWCKRSASGQRRRSGVGQTMDLVRPPSGRQRASTCWKWSWNWKEEAVLKGENREMVQSFGWRSSQSSLRHCPVINSVKKQQLAMALCSAFLLLLA